MIDIACDPGNGVDIEKVYEEYFPKVYNYVYYRLLNRENTEDVVSQVFIKVVKAQERYDPSKASLGTWIYRIADNTLIDYYRARKLNYSLDDEEAGVVKTLGVSFDEQYESIASPEKRELYSAIKQLGERERMLIYYKYFEHKNNIEIGELMDMNSSTVGTHLMRARQKLKAILKDAYE